MQARFGFLLTVVVAAFLAGCGGKEEVKKNEGTIVNVAPTAASPPGGGADSGAPAPNQPLPPPPIPKINE